MPEILAVLKYRASTSGICGAPLIPLGVQYIEPSPNLSLLQGSPLSNSSLVDFGFAVISVECVGRIAKIRERSKFFRSVINSSLSPGR